MILRGHPLAGSTGSRRGTVVALLALSIVALIAFLGLAIDLGMIALAKTQAQNAADLAALTASRTMNGNSAVSYNKSAATTNAQNLLTYNRILGQKITAAQLTLSYGSYDYNQTSQTFAASFPESTGVPTSAVQATVKADTLQGGFSRIFGSQFLPTVTATATAVHRPRDIGLVMDLSGSMRFGTCTGYDFISLSIPPPSRVSNNPDPVFPTFGHYSSTVSAGMQYTGADRTSAFDKYTISPSNITAPTAAYSLTYVNNFYSQNAYATPVIRAFDSYESMDGGKTWTAPAAGTKPELGLASYATTPGGDRPLYLKDSLTTYAKNVHEVLVSSGTALATSANARRWELDGYSTTTSGSFPATDPLTGFSDYSTAPFKGYTRGPGYYGKTFFNWPPDPRRPLTTSGITWTALAGPTVGGADAATIKQFLTDFGYQAADFDNTKVLTTLSMSKGLSNSATSITVSAITGFPTTLPFRIIIDSEILNVTAMGGTGSKTWTVERAQDSTTAAAHANNAQVKLATGVPLYGIYAVTKTSGSRAWPWPNDGGVTLGNYLTSNVFLPGGSRKLLTTDDAYLKIMRLYNWNYAVDNYNSAGTGSSYPGTTPCDWRRRFFGTSDNTRIFSATGSLNLPGVATYTINYNEILRWIKQTDNPFPAQLRAGRVKYYGSIPSAITGTWPSYGSTDQRFWVEFIDYALGFRQTAAGVYYDISPMQGYGSDFTWGTLSRNGVPSATQYMNYADNPARGKLRFWFGPLTMVDYLQNYNMQILSPYLAFNYYFMQPGDSYEAPLYTAKQAYLAAVDTMSNNHPNDWFTIACFSKPRNSANAIERFNCVSAPLGTHYNYAKSALVFPFSTINANGTCNNTEVTPYDADPQTSKIPSANFMDTPRADGETCFAMGLMLCYNQFAVTKTTDNTLRGFTTSTPITFPTGMAGGMGRKGAQKIIIFETDGLANTSATAELVTATGYKYYKIRYDMNKPYASEYPTVVDSVINDTTVLDQVYTIVDQLKADYGSARNPFRLYAIGFGPVYTGADATSAKTTLQTMQYRAGTQSSAATPLPANQIITGTDAQMSANMIATYTSILQKGVQIALIK